MEKLDISQRGSQAKIFGTVVAFAGATLMTLYKGIVLISIHTQHSHQIVSSKASMDKNWDHSYAHHFKPFILCILHLTGDQKYLENKNSFPIKGHGITKIKSE